MSAVPYRDETIPQGFKRTYWPAGDAEKVKRGIAKDVAVKTSRRGKPYSRADQAKIVSEKWGEFCESKPEWRG